MEKELQKALEQMENRWPSSFVARKKISEFTGGMISQKTMANLDCLGQGPTIYYAGRNAGYLTSEYVEWLKLRIKTGRANDGKTTP